VKNIFRYRQKYAVWLICLSIAISCRYARAENYLLNGGQESKIAYQMTQEVRPSANTRKLTLSYVVPVSFSSPTYRQKIKDLSLRFSMAPTRQTETRDDRGNKVIQATWTSPPTTLTTTIRFAAFNSVKLVPLQTHAPFPPQALSSGKSVYLKSTQQVSADDPRIVEKAKALTASARTEFDAVQRILIWIVDHMHYVLTPKRYDALYALETGRGNCQNYSHLAAALMRAVGIPVRIANGITLKQPYDITMGKSTITLKMAQGRHSWIEVFFPDLGWVPFDPQGTEMFVSNRFIRVEVGLDNEETINDGLIRWTRIKGTSGTPKVEESIHAGFLEDQVKFLAKKTGYGPKSLLLCPEIKTEFSKPVSGKEPSRFKEVSEDELKQTRFVKPHTFGNLEFPRKTDFISAYGPARKTDADTMEMRKNFLVETAEYVTTQGKQYAQIFVSNEPLRLQTIALALHKFNNDGQLWLELYKDHNGKPGKYIATSDFVMLEALPYTAGYDWIPFDFKSTSPVLPPGRYWMALGFTGMPIVNWFFTYGKPVGPQYGTRYRMMFDDIWSRSLSFEFNYRVECLTAENR
jgi:transglutaminase-like putative cysteine protease